MSSNEVGARGEWICLLKLTSFHEDAQLFRPVFLGDKWPSADVLAEVVEPTPGGRRGFFLAQVKTSREGYQPNGRLKISGTAREKVAALAAYPVPTYILGVDEPHARVYIVAVQGNFAGMSSISHEYELTRERLVALRDEVHAFWDGLSSRNWTSQFQEANWSARP